jgi:hypothetical protein
VRDRISKVPLVPTWVEIEKFIIRQPPTGEKDDDDSENSWISDGLPSSSRRRRRGDGRWEVGVYKAVNFAPFLNCSPRPR